LLKSIAIASVPPPRVRDARAPTPTHPHTHLQRVPDVAVVDDEVDDAHAALPEHVARAQQQVEHCRPQPVQHVGAGLGAEGVCRGG